jgi:hypothetical protein
MALKDLDGRRTGRPQGPRTTSRVRRDIPWAYRNLDKVGAKPPSAGARLWADLARGHPARFLACVAKLEAPPPEPRPAGRSGPAGPAVTTGRPRRAGRLFGPERRLAYLLGGQPAWRVANLHPGGVRIAPRRPGGRGAAAGNASPAGRGR